LQRVSIKSSEILKTISSTDDDNTKELRELWDTQKSLRRVSADDKVRVRARVRVRVRVRVR
jgi:hypothetical protein